MTNKGELINNFTKQFLRPQPFDFHVGDTLKVYVKVTEAVKGKEGKVRERLQAFEGICIGKRGSGIHETFKVRKVSFGGIGVERTFPMHSPVIDTIEIVRKGKVRRAKLYYLRGRKGKAASVKSAERFH